MFRGKVIPYLSWSDKNTKLWYSISYQDECLRPPKGKGFKYLASNGWMIVASFSPQMGVFLNPGNGPNCCYIMGCQDELDEAVTQVGPEKKPGQLIMIAGAIREAFEEASLETSEWIEYKF